MLKSNFELISYVVDEYMIKSDVKFWEPKLADLITSYIVEDEPGNVVNIKDADYMLLQSFNNTKCYQLFLMKTPDNNIMLLHADTLLYGMEHYYRRNYSIEDKWKAIDKKQGHFYLYRCYNEGETDEDKKKIVKQRIDSSKIYIYQTPDLSRPLNVKELKEWIKNGCSDKRGMTGQEFINWKADTTWINSFDIIDICDREKAIEYVEARYGKALRTLQYGTLSLNTQNNYDYNDIIYSNCDTKEEKKRKNEKMKKELIDWIKKDYIYDD